jgi:glutamate-ammonia-ligase adenylyltransferase
MMPLSSQLQQHWQTVVDRLPADFPVSTLSDQAQSVMAFSDFVEQSLIAQPQWLASLKVAPEAQEWHHYADWLQVRLAEVNDEAALMRELRQFRRRIMVRIAWRRRCRWSAKRAACSS